MDEEYVYRAVFANTTIKGQTFLAVGDALNERGFNMAAATMNDDGSLVVPHTQPRRRPARLWFEAPTPPPPFSQTDWPLAAKPKPAALDGAFVQAAEAAAFCVVVAQRVSASIRRDRHRVGEDGRAVKLANVAHDSHPK